MHSKKECLEAGLPTRFLAQDEGFANPRRPGALLGRLTFPRCFALQAALREFVPCLAPQGHDGL